MHQAMLSFNAGEVTPYLRHRIDFDKTSASAEEMENFLAMPYGGVIKRPGLKWLAATLTAGSASKAFPFIASDGTQYVVHFAGYVAGVSAGVITIYRAADGTVAATLSDSATDGPHPSYLWASAAPNLVRSLQMTAVNDVMFFAHANLHPFQIRRMSDTYWKLEWIPFENPPLLDENLNEDLTLKVVSDPQAVAWVTGTVYKVSNVVTYGGNTYTCILSHTAAAAGGSNTPVGTNHATYWVSGNAGTPDWEAGKVYVVGDTVAHLEGEWVCRYGHTSSSANNSAITANEPGVGKFYGTGSDDGTGWETWKDFWARKMFLKGESVKLFLADAGWKGFQAGVGWGEVWYNAGDVVYYNGIGYKCLVTHNQTSWISAGAQWDKIDEVFPAVATTQQSPGTFLEIKVDRHDMDQKREMKAIAAMSGRWTVPIQCSGRWQFFTYGSWIGTFYLQESKDNGVTWKQIRAFHAVLDRNVADAGTLEYARLLRLGFERDISGADDPNNSTLVPDDVFVHGRVQVTERVTGGYLKGVVINPLISGTTFRWSKSAFTEASGFPRGVALHESRLCFAGTADHPVSLWMSRSDDFLNFETGTNADHAIFVTMATSVRAPIQWLVSQRRLFIGTALGEWVAGSETSDAPITPADCVIRQYAAVGSAPLQPLLVGPSLLFASRAAGRLMEMSYSAMQEVYDTADLSRLAEHLTHGGIQSMAWQQTREPGLWAVRADGVLLHFAYSRAEKIAAWSRHTTAGGLFQDAVVFPSDEGDDEVFFVVDRGSVSCLERFPQHWQEAVEADGTGIPWFHLDGVSGTGTTISIPAHLRGIPILKVTMATAGATIPTVATATFSGATQTITNAHWQIGTVVASRLASLPIDTQVQDGTTQARRKRQHKLLLSLFRSRGGYIWNTREAAKQPIVNTQATVCLRTGWEETIPDAGHLDDLQLHVLHDDPFPFCLRCAVMRWKLHES